MSEVGEEHCSPPTSSSGQLQLPQQPQPGPEQFEQQLQPLAAGAVVSWLWSMAPSRIMWTSTPMVLQPPRSRNR
ncbi:hypothetical protein GIY23_08250 [Allosaccharopolyspora coralli]|uniref:Uncharacterized protein n=1 Tax=Allosaccharopolyspora coralli TaxID=2665642 RepID=A0A5Q3QDF5_9PSEU|nr:hypothetical protein [Allosaccharopolyspora coralli]QGK69515.1 hypothetical protein GIY23_08250 [Allosaccharopolyspora coralli]